MKKKLSLKELEVKSFVTNLEKGKKEVIGGAALDISQLIYSACRTCGIVCMD